LLIGGANAQTVPQYSGTWFNAASPWNTPLPTAGLEYTYAPMQAILAAGRPMTLAWNSWTDHVIYGDSSVDPTQNLVVNDPWGARWILPNVPVNQNVIASLQYAASQGDGDTSTCIFDNNTQGFYTFWHGVLDSTGQHIASISTGGYFPISGTGWGSNVYQQSPNPGAVAGSSYCGGVIRYSEIANSTGTKPVINHALSIVWPNNFVLSVAKSTAALSNCTNFAYLDNYFKASLPANSSYALADAKRFALASEQTGLPGTYSTKLHAPATNSDGTATTVLAPASATLSSVGALKTSSADVNPCPYTLASTGQVTQGNSGLVKMGGRIQLDPTLTDSQLLAMGLNSGTDLSVAHALQKYGGFITDTTFPPGNIQIQFESAYGNGASTFQGTNPWPTAVYSHIRYVLNGPLLLSSGISSSVGISESAYPAQVPGTGAKTATMVSTNPSYKPIKCKDIINSVGQTFHGTVITQDMANKCINGS
jgi:hypothetical protein